MDVQYPGTRRRAPLQAAIAHGGGKIPAGFPSSADDFASKRYDVNELLITHPLATFFRQVSGESMREAGIFDSDILVVPEATKEVARTSAITTQQ